MPIEQERDRIESANRHMGEQGLRVLAFAARLVPDEELPLLHSDPMALTTGLGFVGMVGIIDPLRPSAKAAVEKALKLTGNHGISRNNPLERHHRDVLCGRIHSPQEDTVRVGAGRLALGI